MAAIARIDDYLDLFVRGADGDLYTGYWNGSAWSAWADFGTVPSGNASSPALASANASNLQVFKRGQNGAVYTQLCNGTSWSGSWTALGVPAAGAVSDPAAYADATLTMVASRATDGNIYATSYEGTWGPWVSLGAP